ncbi:60S ribosomal protein L27-like [Penaeus japonicus]|uniref:60S ribosomal protein L27-like n=1 Tax=Penaeus japonicus TaxID=27405 RepID=UPI001C70DCE5|nr:60S ribosomal protein L27-like [Penaeus japonicus]XP_042859809.1 60S ribosomal protein L27-like [Penaeus japonicus]
MVKIFKPGRVVIMLNGRHTGKKGIVVKTNEEGTRDRPFEHALVVGIDRYPRRVKKSMSKSKIARRSTLKPFVRIVNLKHMMPTRYTTTDIVFNKDKVNKEILKDPGRRQKLRQVIKAQLEERYKTGRNRWLFQKLRF